MQSLPLRPCCYASFVCERDLRESSLALAQHVSTGQVHKLGTKLVTAAFATGGRIGTQTRSRRLSQANHSGKTVDSLVRVRATCVLEWMFRSGGLHQRP